MFRYDSGIMTFLGKVADIVFLNLLTLLCCIPIVTIGASITAAHYTALKIYRDTDNYVVKNFFKSFKANLRQGTLIWILWVVLVILDLFAYSFYPDGGINTVFKVVLILFLIFIVMTTMWLFPMQAKFINPIRITIKNAFILSCRHVFRTLGMLVVTAAGIALWLFLSIQWYWIPIFFGFSIPIYLSTMMYNKVFEELEDQIRERETVQTDSEGEAE